MGWCDGFGRGGMMDGFGRGGMMGGGGFLFPFLGFLIFAVLAVAVVLFVIWLIRRAGRTGTQVSSGGAADTPLFVAKGRLAAGEITVEEFERIRSYLVDHEET